MAASRILVGRDGGPHAEDALALGRLLSKPAGAELVRPRRPLGAAPASSGAGPGVEKPRLAGHTGAVNDVAFAPDDSIVATASADGTVRLWDPRTGRQSPKLRGHDGIVRQVAFSPDGSKLASAGSEGTVRVWALELDDLVELAERSLTRELTGDECRQYLRDRGC